MQTSVSQWCKFSRSSTEAQQAAGQINIPDQKQKPLWAFDSGITLSWRCLVCPYRNLVKQMGSVTHYSAHFSKKGWDRLDLSRQAVFA